MTRERLKALLSEYGRVAVYTYLALFILVLAGFTVAIAWGVAVETTYGGASALGAAYLATKATQPLRIAATLGLTPLLAAALKKLGSWRTARRTAIESSGDEKQVRETEKGSGGS